MKQTILLLVIFILSSFKCKKQEDFLKQHTPEIYGAIDNKQLQFNGIYKFTMSENNIANDMVSELDYTKFVYFFGNGFCSQCVLYSHTDSLLASALINRENCNEVKEGGGIFSISRDSTIKTIYRTNYTYKSMPRFTFAVFSGHLLNKDTIENFRMTKPYPKHFTASDTIPRILVFHEFPIKTTLDSNNYYIKKFIK